MRQEKKLNKLYKQYLFQKKVNPIESDDEIKKIKKEHIFVLFILCIFLILRFISWSNVSTVEDHDSINYLLVAKIINSHQWNKLNSIDTFFYPVFINLLYMIGIKLETAGRIVSMFFSTLFFFIIYLGGKKLTTAKNILITLLLLSFSPFLITFSFSVLSEPTYITIVYIGVMIFWKFIDKPKYLLAFLLGIIFSLSFSARTEGISFLFFIPLLQSTYYIIWGKKSYSLSKLFTWISLFIVGFSIVTAPIIIFVSNQVGTFSINGRTAWEQLLKNDKRSYEEKVQGLDFSSSQTNLDYVISHPQVIKEKNLSSEFIYNLKLVFNNLKQLSQNKLSSAVGIFILAFVGLGIYHFFIHKRFRELFFILSFIVIVLIPPMLLSSFIERHIAIVIPLILLLSSAGIYEFSQKIESIAKEKKLSYFTTQMISIFIITLIAILSLSWLNDALRYPSRNKEYNMKNYTQPINILKNDIKKHNITDPKLISRKSYFPFFAGAEPISLPYTNYPNLVEYIRLNHGNYLFLNYQHLKNYPFLDKFNKTNLPNFILLYDSPDSSTSKIKLYRFINK